jgi:hypothetical protein
MKLQIPCLNSITRGLLTDRDAGIFYRICVQVIPPTPNKPYQKKKIEFVDSDLDVFRNS